MLMWLWIDVVGWCRLLLERWWLKERVKNCYDMIESEIYRQLTSETSLTGC
jgi:hypothetical protein